MTFEIWDAGKEDGDVISIFVDGNNVLKNFTIAHDVKRVEIDLENRLTEIRIEAVNEGSIPPNTANIKLYDSNKEIDLFTDLHYQKFTTITVVKR